jgi:hypothetical protein
VLTRGARRQQPQLSRALHRQEAITGLQLGVDVPDMGLDQCIVLERYKDSEALIEHAAHLGDLTQAILATGYVSGELLGEPGAELRANLADGPVRLFTPYQSM